MLIDDVMTSGSTLQEAALALQRAGCATVVGVVLARTEKPGFERPPPQPGASPAVVPLP